MLPMYAYMYLCIYEIMAVLLRFILNDGAHVLRSTALVILITTALQAFANSNLSSCKEVGPFPTLDLFYQSIGRSKPCQFSAAQRAVML